MSFFFEMICEIWETLRLIPVKFFIHIHLSITHVISGSGTEEVTDFVVTTRKVTSPIEETNSVQQTTSSGVDKTTSLQHMINQTATDGTKREETTIVMPVTTTMLPNITSATTAEVGCMYDGELVPPGLFDDLRYIKYFTSAYDAKRLEYRTFSRLFRQSS